jgi:hypothetical protein
LGVYERRAERPRQRTDEAVADIEPGRMIAAAGRRELTGDADFFPVTGQAC